MNALAVPVLALIWAGVSLGGSLVAAPAKFEAPSLDLPTALEVGRAQFFWLGFTEAVLCALLTLAWLAGRRTNGAWMIAPIGLFALQRLAVMPTLDARTVAIIGGATPGESALHLIYIVLEILKFVTLIAAAVFMLQASSRGPEAAA